MPVDVSKKLIQKAVGGLRANHQGRPAALAEVDASDGREVELCRCIANGMTLAQAAQAVGVSIQTARRWRYRPDFQKRYADMVRQTDDATVALRARLNLIAHDAVDLLQQFIDSTDEEIPPKVKLEAAKTVLNHSDLKRSDERPLVAQINVAVQQIQSAEEALSLLKEAEVVEVGNDG